MEENQIFYIKLENGLPTGNPFLLDNLKQCGINPENSDDWAQHFPLDTPPPIIRRTEIVEPISTFDGKISKVIWSVRKMTDEELSSLPSNNLDKISGSVPNVI